MFVSVKTLKTLSIALVAIMLSLGFASCGGGGSDDDNGGNSGNTGGGGTTDPAPVVTILNTSGLQSMQVTINCKVVTNATLSPINVGIVIGSMSQPTIINSDYNLHPTAISASAYTVTATGLHPSTTYFCRAYYYNGTTTYYSAPTTIVTPAATISAVDLGLSSQTMWAATNVGAEEPTQMGYYFAWGETTPMTTSRSKAMEGVLRNVGEINGTPIGDLSENLLRLDPAYVYLGKDWRTPSSSQMDELRKECTWTWCDGVNTKYQGSSAKGYKVTSKVNENSIFLPATGYCDKGTMRNTANGYYRSRLEQQTPPQVGVVLYFSDQLVSASSRTAEEGCTIRPVRAFR